MRLLAPMPQGFKRLAMVRLLGARIDRSNDPAVDRDNRCSRFWPRSRIGHLTVLCVALTWELVPWLATSIGITAAPVFQSRGEDAIDGGCFILGRESAVTSRHYVDPAYPVGSEPIWPWRVILPMVGRPG
jgi:hypothetical protein